MAPKIIDVAKTITDPIRPSLEWRITRICQPANGFKHSLEQTSKSFKRDATGNPSHKASSLAPQQVSCHRFGPVRLGSAAVGSSPASAPLPLTKETKAIPTNINAHVPPGGWRQESKTVRSPFYIWRAHNLRTQGMCR